MVLRSIFGLQEKDATDAQPEDHAGNQQLCVHHHPLKHSAECSNIVLRTEEKQRQIIPQKHLFYSVLSPQH